MNDDFLELLSNADPATLNQLVESALGPQRTAAYGNQQSAQGRDVGHTYVASSPLEHLANALKGIQAQQAITGVGQGKKNLLMLQKQAQQARQAASGTVGPTITDGLMSPNENPQFE